MGDSADSRRVRELRTRVRGRPERVEPPGPGRESVWDYPRPPRVEPVPSEVRVEIAGALLASSRLALRVLETAGAPVYYLPPGDVRTELLEPSSRTSLCEWKGTARYWSVRVADRFELDAAWGYPEPFEGYASIRDHLAFYARCMDRCSVGGETATPQPGGFYGGWVTSGVVGPFKGESGSEGW